VLISHQTIGRRAFMTNGMLVLSAAASKSFAGPSADGSPALEATRFGLVTDLHYADKPAAGSRHYRETLRKLDVAAAQFAQEEPTFLVELGDLIDAADSVATEQRYLATINKPFAAISEDRHYVLGNHCVDTLTKEEFLGSVGQPKSYYSFDRGGFHFIVLDACFRADGQPYGRRNFNWTDANMPPAEIEWLADDLSRTSKRTVVFAHQRLDTRSAHGVKNGEQVRQVLTTSGKVLAVFQGHSHQNDLTEIDGIHYCTLVAMVEGTGEASNGFASVRVMTDGSLHVKGFQVQKSYDWEQRS
jgi:predicted phosphodiesterase